MQKIAKFISSALNNSSANEAAQALKMAAVMMQDKGVNPADLLQRKGEEQPEQPKPSNSAELKEAKELAIYWHNVAKATQDEARELAIAAVKAQEAEKVSYNRAVDWKNRFIYSIVALASVAVLSGLVINEQAENIHRANHRAAYTQPAPVRTVQEAPIQLDALKATCTIQKAVINTTTKKSFHLKAWFNNGIVTTFADGKLMKSGTSDNMTTREEFVNVTNKKFSGSGVDCKLGVNE